MQSGVLFEGQQSRDQNVRAQAENAFISFLQNYRFTKVSGKLQVVKNVNISLRVNLCMTFTRTITGSGCVGTAEIKGDCERGGKKWRHRGDGW